MSTGKIIFTTVLTTLAALGVIAAVGFAVMPGDVQAGAYGKFAGGHGFAGHGRGHGSQDMTAHCDKFSPDNTRIVEAVIGAKLDLNDEQKQALAPIISVVDDLRADAQNSCQQMPPQDVDAGLAMMEHMLQKSADAVAQIRPAYQTFYTGLDAEQQADIQDMIKHHRGRRH